MLNILLVSFSILMIGMGAEAASKSMVSLIAGATIGLLMLGSVALAKSNPRAGRIMSLVVALLPLGRFLPKFLKEQQIWPAGVAVISSVIVIVALVAGHVFAMRKRSTPS